MRSGAVTKSARYAILIDRRFQTLLASRTVRNPVTGITRAVTQPARTKATVGGVDNKRFVYTDHNRHHGLRVLSRRTR